MRYGFLILLLLNATSAVAEFDPSQLEPIRAQYNLPGLTAAQLVKGKSQIWSSGVRRIETPSAPLQKEDRFHLGSCTKSMTATLVAIAVEQKKLEWSSPLSEVFPELNINSELKNVTIEMLTAHRSGLTGNMFDFNDGTTWKALWASTSSTQEDRQFVAEQLLTKTPQTKPGSTFEYSNWNYIIVGAILEKVLQKPWETLMQENIFQPLGMSSCGFGSPASTNLPPDQPWPHTISDNKVISILPDALSDNPKSFAPAGNVHCNLSDWGIYLQTHIDGFNGLDSKILKAKNYKKLHTSFPGQDYTYGGWIRFERDWAKGPVLHHTGSNTFNFANVWLAPQINKGFIAVTNIGTLPTAFDATDAVIGSLVNSK